MVHTQGYEAKGESIKFQVEGEAANRSRHLMLCMHHLTNPDPKV